ncbi:family 16 glycosylhydrolase [Specibacter sp. NPDC057265]|uniref:glycoside hydrolase family 16 protein n=1 Tax=Specibacter sp. NPDC057265 TaxID=3346075 RepID=UPI0036442E20
MTTKSITAPSARTKKRPARMTAGVLSAAILASLVPAIGANAAETSYVTQSSLLNDSMSRTVSNSWGTASNTVKYSGATSALAVSGGTAKLSLDRPGKSVTTEAVVKSTDAEASYQVSVDKLPTSGSGVYSSLHLRHSGTGFYRTTLQVTPQGKSYLEISRSNKGKITVLKKTALPLTIKSGQKVNVELRATGTSAVNLQAKVWPTGTTEPAAAALSFDDKTAAKISTAGNVAVSGYLSGGSQASTLRYDDLKLSSLKVAPAATVKPVPLPTPVKPVAPAPVKPVVPAPVKPAVPAPTPAGFRQGWGEPVFRDEFNSPLTQWNVRDNDSLSYDSARIKAANVKVSDGLLHIEGKKEKANGRDFTSGYIDSIGKFEQQYGRWEVRAKIPTTPGDSRGIWPAFWLRNSGVGEIDIMEAWGDPFDNPTKVGTSSFTVHESTNGGGQRKGWNWETQAGTKVNSSQGFHTWAIEYTPTELKGYFDDKQVITATKAQYPWLWGANFQTKFNMRLNLQIGSPYHGQPIGPDYKDTKSYSDFQIDYVRAWAYKG